MATRVELLPIGVRTLHYEVQLNEKDKQPDEFNKQLYAAKDRIIELQQILIDKI